MKTLQNVQNVQDVSKFSNALDRVEEGLNSGFSCSQMAKVLGTGITAH